MEHKHYPYPDGASCLVVETGQKFKGLDNRGEGPKSVTWHELLEPVTNQKEDLLTEVFQV